MTKFEVREAASSFFDANIDHIDPSVEDWEIEDCAIEIYEEHERNISLNNLNKELEKIYL